MKAAKNMDERLRRRQREARLGGVEAQAALLAERVRSGELDPRLALQAARLGRKDAQLIIGEKSKLLPLQDKGFAGIPDKTLRSTFELLAGLDPAKRWPEDRSARSLKAEQRAELWERPLLVFGCDCAEHVLEIYESWVKRRRFGLQAGSRAFVPFSLRDHLELLQDWALGDDEIDPETFRESVDIVQAAAEEAREIRASHAVLVVIDTVNILLQAANPHLDWAANYVKRATARAASAVFHRTFETARGSEKSRIRKGEAAETEEINWQIARLAQYALREAP